MILLDVDYGVLIDESLKIGVPVLLAVFGGLGTLLTFLGFKSSTAKKEDASKSFNNIVDELASAEIKTNIAAAIKIRRFFAADIKKHSAHLCKEAINVISSLLRVRTPKDTSRWPGLCGEPVAGRPTTHQPAKCIYWL